jgi:hypothetical protein
MTARKTKVIPLVVKSYKVIHDKSYVPKATMKSVRRLKRFSEDYRETPFDWNEFLNKKKFKSTEIEDAYRIAAKWTTCACGNQCAIIPRKYDGEPEDNILRELGIDFFMAIKRMEESKEWIYAVDPNESYLKQLFEKNREKAKLILKKIERRSLILIDRVRLQKLKKRLTKQLS